MHVEASKRREKELLKIKMEQSEDLGVSGWRKFFKIAGKRRRRGGQFGRTRKIILKASHNCEEKRKK